VEGGERDADRVADAVGEQGAEADAMERDGIGVIPPADRVALDEDVSPVSGRRFSRA